jgi:peptide deformylase
VKELVSTNFSTAGFLIYTEIIMILKQVTQVGNPVIRTRSSSVNDALSKETKTIIKNLTDSMRHHELVGMAAPQIGKLLRIFVTEIRKTKIRKGSDIRPDPLRVFINPVIVSYSKKVINDWEGCGSVAFSCLFAKVRRAQSLTIEAIDEKGVLRMCKATGLLARIIQHEIDHLDGIVFTDRADCATYTSKNEYLHTHKKNLKITNKEK